MTTNEGGGPVGSSLERGDRKDSPEITKGLFDQFLAIALSPVWTRMQKAIVEAITSRLDGFLQAQDKRWEQYLAAANAAPAKESVLAAEIARLQDELAAEQKRVEGLAEEYRRLKDSRPGPTLPDEVHTGGEDVVQRTQAFPADLEGVKAAAVIAGERVLQRHVGSSDARKDAFLVELRRLIPSARERIFATESDNIIFIQADRRDPSGSSLPEWLIILNRASSDSVGPAIGKIFRNPEGGPSGALNRRFNEIEVIRPAVIPGDVRFAADDPFIAPDYVRIERIEPGVLRVT